MRALLDVNVLIALHDSDHALHERAAQWFDTNARFGWASCPLTQNGCLRIMNQPGYGQPQPLSVLVAMLCKSVNTEFHAFWNDDISILDPSRFRHSHMHSPRQLTDLYLLALAVKNGGRFVTFDLRIPSSVVAGAQDENLVVL
jgi:toxin-antitoxin system PIN domain toxin